MLIDDYIKNAEQSLSETQRKAIWEWFKSTAYTRLEPGASLIILATRWHLNDLIGQCMTDMPEENWTVINLPMFAMENDPLGREVDEVLWPERYDYERCKKIEKALGKYWFQAMCQQDPLPSMGGADIGDRLKIIEQNEIPPAEELKRTRAWDLAATEQAGDWTAGVKVALNKSTGRFLIEDVVRCQKSPAGVEVQVDTAADLDGHGVPIWMEQEPGSSGKVVIEHYKKFLAGYNFQGEKATGPPEVRASPFMAAVEQGKVDMVRGDWNQAFIDEWNGFPDGDHDDQCIATALGYNKLVKGMYGGLTWGRAAASDKVIPITRAKATQRTHRRRVSNVTW
jgi:predicted phage terminase large subunit-like protein